MWKIVAGYRVFIENGMIKRVIKNGRTAYVYRWNRKNGCWTAEGDITPAAFRSGLARETIAVK